MRSSTGVELPFFLLDRLLAAYSEQPAPPELKQPIGSRGGTENPGVAGSIPALATLTISLFHYACGDGYRSHSHASSCPPNRPEQQIRSGAAEVKFYRFKPVCADLVIIYS